jgi:hypothetical protein
MMVGVRRSLLSRKVRNPIGNDWVYDTTTTTSPNQSPAAVRAELGLGTDFSGLDATIRPTLGRIGGQIEPMSRTVTPRFDSSAYAGAAGLGGVSSGSFPAPKPAVGGTTISMSAPDVVAQAAAAEALQALAPKFDSSAYAGAAGVTGVPSISAAAKPKPVFGGYTQTDADRFIEAIKASADPVTGLVSGGAGAFGAPSIADPTPTYGQDVLWADYIARQTEQETADAEAAAAAAAAQAAAAAEQQRIADLTGSYTDSVNLLNEQLLGLGGTYDDLSAGAQAQYDTQLAALNELYSGLISEAEGRYAEQQATLDELFAGYGTQLGAATEAATGKIDQASAQALARLAGIDPQAQFMFDVTAGGVPQAASADYLRAIGASTADVDAAQQLGQSLLEQQLASAQQYSAGSYDALMRERAAREAAAGLISQDALSRLAAQQAVYESQLAGQQTAQSAAIANALADELASFATGQLSAQQDLSNWLFGQQTGFTEAEADEAQRLRELLLEYGLSAAAEGVDIQDLISAMLNPVV